MLSLTPRLTKTITHCPLLLSISLLLNCLLLSISLLLNCFHYNSINSNRSLVVEQPLSIRSCLQWWGQHTVVTLILSIYIKLGVLLLLSVPLTISFCCLFLVFNRILSKQNILANRNTIRTRFEGTHCATEKLVIDILNESGQQHFTPPHSSLISTPAPPVSWPRLLHHSSTLETRSALEDPWPGPEQTWATLRYRPALNMEDPTKTWRRFWWSWTTLDTLQR